MINAQRSALINDLEAKQCGTRPGSYITSTILQRHLQVQTKQPALIFQRRSRTPHFGVRIQGAMTPTSNSAEIFVLCTYPQVSSSYVYSFESYRVDKHTHKKNKQTDATENIQRS